VSRRKDWILKNETNMKKIPLLARLASLFGAKASVSSFETYRDVIMFHYSSGNYGKALEYAQKATDNYPDFAEAHLAAGFVLMGQEQFSQAIAAFQKAIDIDPSFTLAYYNMGVVSSKLKNYSEAIRYYQKVIDIDPFNGVAHYSMGYAYGHLEEYPEAMQCFKKAAQLGLPEAQEALRETGESW
jgi:superkiller protein 3